MSNATPQSPRPGLLYLYKGEHSAPLPTHSSSKESQPLSPSLLAAIHASSSSVRKHSVADCADSSEAPLSSSTPGASPHHVLPCARLLVAGAPLEHHRNRQPERVAASILTAIILALLAAATVRITPLTFSYLHSTPHRPPPRRCSPTTFSPYALPPLPCHVAATSLPCCATSAARTSSAPACMLAWQAMLCHAPGPPLIGADSWTQSIGRRPTCE